MTRLFIVLAVVALMLSSASTAPAQEEHADPIDPGIFRLTLEGEFLYGSVDGYVQTPSGGEPGSSSHGRPKLSEIGIDDAALADVQLVAGWHNEEIYIGGQFAELSGDDTLGRELTSQGQTFAAGSNVSSDLKLDWYRVGYRHRFVLLDDQSLTVSPSIGGAFLDYQFSLDSPGGPSVDRHFTKGALQIGVEAEWRPNHGPFALDLRLLGSPPIDGMAQINQEQLVASYRFHGGEGHRPALAGFLGIAFQQIEFEDNQRLSNHLHVEFGPLLVVGLQLKF